MNIFETIQMESFSTSESVLSDAICKDPYHIASLKMEDIMRKYHISRATAYRFLEKIGMSGLSELKVRILADAAKWEAANAFFDFNYPIADGVSAQKITENLERDYTQTILSTKICLTILL